MKHIRKLFFTLFVCSTIFPLQLWAQAPAGKPITRTYQVSSIEFDGNERIDAEALRQSIVLNPGSISSDAVSDAIKTLYKTGFFDQVTAELVPVQGKSNKLVFRVVEKPVVRKVFIKGNEEISEEDLSEILKFDEKRFVDKAIIFKIIKQAETYYQAEGFYDAKFDYSILSVGSNQVDITFQVTEGEKYKIREVVVRGLKVLDEDELVDILETRTYKWYNSWLFGTGRVNQDVLNNDKLLLQQYLLDHGHIDGSVSDGAVEKIEDGLRVSFEITEGPVYKIGSVDVSGDLIDESKEKTLEGTKQVKGEVFSASALREDTFTISDKFSDIGYAFVNVVPNTPVDRQLQEVQLNYKIDKGDPVTVDRIHIKGNDKTYDNVIRRELKIAEQELYSGSKVRRSQELLQRLGYFEEVNIATKPREQDKKTVDLEVNVREGATGTFSAGAGYSSSDGALFNARLTEANFLGTGRSVSINSDIGARSDNIILSLDDRRFLDSHWAVGVNGLLTEREFSDFDRELAGGGATVGYPIEEFIAGKWAEDISFFTRYEYLTIEIDNVDPADAAQLVIDSQGTSSVSGVTPRLERNTINNPLDPTEGSLQSVSVELTGLGGSEEYYLTEARNQWYTPLLDEESGFPLTFSWRIRFNYGETYDGDPFPLFRRFFPGGINSVRGFKNRTLGPKDAEGNEFGGSKQVVNNLELIFPIIRAAGLNGVVFYDVGEAFDDDQSITVGELRQAVGYGIRWTSPLGPIRVEFGYPIDRESGEDGMVTLFSFGAPL